MTRIFVRLGRWALQFAVGFVIVLALLVGVARLLLPEASRFADDIRRVAATNTGMELDFQLLSAGVSLYGPELRLSGVTLRFPDEVPVLVAGEVAVALDLWKLLTRAEMLPSLIHVESADLDIQINAAGELLLQGRPWVDFITNRNPQDRLPELRIKLEGIALSFSDQRRASAQLNAVVHSLFARINDDALEIEADVEPSKALGRVIEIDALVPMQLLRVQDDLAADTSWRVQILAQEFQLDSWLRLADIADAPIIDSNGSAEIQVEFSGIAPVSMQTELDLEQVVLSQPHADPVVFERVAGLLTWSKRKDGYRASGKRIQVERQNSKWPDSQFSVDYRQLADNEFALDADASFVRIEDLLPLLRALVPDPLSKFGVTGQAVGDVWNGSANFISRDGHIESFDIEAAFGQLGYTASDPDVDIRGISGEVKASEDGGRVNLLAEDARFGLGAVFRAPLEITRLEGLAVWRAGAEGYRLIANDLFLETAHGSGSATLELVSDLEFERPVVDLSAEASMHLGKEIYRYLPRKIPDKVVAWLKQAITSGSSPHTRFLLRGPLREFPFRDDQGTFLIDIDFVDAGLKFAPDWPAIESASGRLIFENESMYTDHNQLRIAGIDVQNAHGRVDDLREGVVALKASGPAPLDAVLGFLKQSPIGPKLGPVFADLRAAGQATGSLSLTLPLKQLDEWQLQGELTLHDGSTWLANLEPRFTALEGTLSIYNRYIRANSLTGKLLDAPVKLRIQPNDSPDAPFSHLAQVVSTQPYEAIESALNLPSLGVLSGAAEFKAAAFFPAFRENAAPFSLHISSDLEGLISSLPHPLAKAAERREDFAAELHFPERGRIELRAALARGLEAYMDFAAGDDGWQLSQGTVALAGAPLQERPVDGIALSAYIDRLEFSDWLTAFAGESAPAEPALVRQGRWQDMFDSAELMVSELRMFGFRFTDTDIRAAFGDDAWDVEIAGPWLEGRLTVPYELDGPNGINATLDRLLLIEALEGAEDSDDEGLDVSPLDFPAFKGTVDDFALGILRLGHLDVDVRRTDKGLETRRLNTRAESFSIEASGDWQVVDSAQRSRLHMEFASTDVQDTLVRLGYSPFIDATSAKMVSDLLWEGAPGMAAIEASTGEIELVISNGVVNEIDAGGGRVLGLLSITSLPRRMALDFSDMTEDKLAFEKISGNFRMDFGDAWTCNLGLTGEVADMAFVGRAGMRAQDYSQVAVVRPHVSNLMPVPAAFLGGPTLGVAALLVSQIFKKPLSGIGESYYTIDGPWADPVVARVQRTDLNTAPFADCEQQLPELSPEEIAAIRDLMTASQAEANSGEKSLQPELTEQTQGSVNDFSDERQ